MGRPHQTRFGHPLVRLPRLAHAWAVKGLCVFVVAYALSPIDLIPDFIPVLGNLDDALLLPGLIWLAIRLLPNKVVTDSRVRADEWVAAQGKRPTSKAAQRLSS